MLVNCAGISISGKFEEVEVDRFKVSTVYAHKSIIAQIVKSLWTTLLFVIYDLISNRNSWK